LFVDARLLGYAGKEKNNQPDEILSAESPLFINFVNIIDASKRSPGGEKPSGNFH